MKISKLSKITLAILLALSLVFAMAPVTVFAAETSVTKEIKIVKKIDGSPSEDATFTFTLTPETDSTPMPSNPQDLAESGSESDSDSRAQTITIKGEDTASVFITYTNVGDYTYEVKEVDEGLQYYTYDTSVYKVTVHVRWSNDGQLEAFENAYKNGSTDKSSDIIFTNKYRVPSPYVTPTPTPSEPESSTPSEPDEDTDSKTETPGNTTPENSDSSDTESTDSESPSKSDNRHNNGTPENPDSDEPNGSTPTTDEQPDTDTVTVPTAVPASVANPVTGNSTTPKTGDSSQVILWAAVAVGSGIILFFGFFLILKKRK